MVPSELANVTSQMTAGSSRPGWLKSRSNTSGTWLQPAVNVAQLLSVDALTLE